MGILDKLRSMGIGVKSDYQRQREANPRMRQFGSRGGPNYADIRQQEGINREAGVNLKRYEGRLKAGERVRNINGISYVVPAAGTSTGVTTTFPQEQRERVYVPPAETYSQAPTSVGGPVDRGMYSGLLTPQKAFGGPAATSYSADPMSAGGGVDRGMYSRPMGSAVGGQIPFQSQPTAVESKFNPQNLVYVDPVSGQTRIQDAQGRDYDKAKFREFDEATHLATGVSGVPVVEGNPARYVFDAITGLFRTMHNNAAPGTTDQTVRAQIADDQRKLQEEKISVAQEIQAENGFTAREMASPQVQRMIAEETARRRGEEEIRRQDLQRKAMKSVTPELLEYDANEQQRMINRALENNVEYQKAMSGVTPELLEYDANEQQRMLNRAENVQSELEAMDAVDPIPVGEVTPPAIERTVEEFDPFGNVVTSRQAIAVDQPETERVIQAVGFAPDQWEAYKQGVADIESSGGDYKATRGQHLGKYQMSDDARSDAAKSLGFRNPTKEEFLNSPILQERMFAEYTRRNYMHLIRNSPEFRAMSPTQQMKTLARGQLGAENLRRTLAGEQSEKIDALGTKSIEFERSVSSRFDALENNVPMPARSRFDDMQFYTP